MTGGGRAVRAVLACLATLTTSAAQESGEFDVPPRVVTAGAIAAEVVEPAFELPWSANDDDRALRGRLTRLVAQRFETGNGDACCASFGDLVAAGLALRDRPRALELLLARIEARRPDVWAEVGDVLPALLRDANVRGAAWNPEVERFDDGILFGPPLTLGVAPMPGWRRVEGSQTVQQAATLLVADLEAIEAAENDYRPYRDHVGATYLSIYPVPGTHLRGTRDGAPFAALRVAFESDLPFPFTSYHCELQVWKHLDEQGHLVTATWTTSPDFLWLGGSTLYLPIRDRGGDFVAMLAVRCFGFDLRGVPDGDANRRAGMRSVLGNLRRAAEARFAARDRARPLVLGGAIPLTPVLGRR